MIKREVELKASSKEVAELLFELSDMEVAETFSHWKKLFDEEYERRKKDGEPIWIFDLNHFMLYVIDHLDDDGKDLVRCMYSNLVYRLVDKTCKKHMLELY